MKRTKTVERGLELLLLFSKDKPYLSVIEMMNALLIPRSTIYRYIKTLEENGLIESKGNGYYKIGWRAIDLARHVVPTEELVKVALPIMQSIAEKSSETVTLTVAMGTRVTIVESVSSLQQLKLVFKVGDEKKMHLGAASKIIFAHIDDIRKSIVFDELTSDGYSLESINKIKDELKLIRNQGYVITKEEVDVGALAVAAPIIAYNRSLIAGLTVVGPINRMHKEKLLAIKAELIKATKEMTTLINENSLV